MKRVGFIVTGMTILKYFLPIVKKLKLVGEAECVFFVPDVCIGKYNSIHRNRDRFLHICKKEEIKIESLSQVNLFSGVIFQIEGDGLPGPKREDQKVFSFTYMTDFTFDYEKYINKVDHVIFPSQKFADFYDKKSSKNLYFGSPKYDVPVVEKDVLLKKYGLNNDKYVLYVAPRNRDISKIDTTKIVNKLKNHGYKIICKSRMKDVVSNEKIFDRVFYDNSWFPHDTLELMQCADFVVNFNSTTVKESIISEKPVIDFKVKPSQFSKLQFLYDYDFCKNIKPEDFKADPGTLDSAIEYIVSKQSFEFEKCIKKDLFERSEVCNKIFTFTKDLM